MRFFITYLLIGLFFIQIKSQVASKESALIYFNDYKSKKKMNDLILQSFPTIDDARKIFNKEVDAQQFMKLIVATEKKMKEEPVSDDEDYLTAGINTFTIKDIKESKTNYNLGLLEILDKFKPTVRFFTVKLEEENLFATGHSFIYWMYLNKKWVFVSRPNLAFRK